MPNLAGALHRPGPQARFGCMLDIHHRFFYVSTMNATLPTSPCGSIPLVSRKRFPVGTMVALLSAFPGHWCLGIGHSRATLRPPRRYHLRRHLRRITAVLLSFLASPLFAADYHVSPAGRDDGDGSAAKPFATIARASQKLQPGDRCILHASTYRETIHPAQSGQPDKPIAYLAAPGEKVTISGADPVTGTWQPAGPISTISLAGPVQQFFSGGQMLPEARFPNCTPDQIMDYPRAEAGQGTGYETLNDPKLPPGDATGGIVLIWNGDRWSSSTRKIARYSPGQSLSFDRTYKPEKRDEYHTHDPYQPKATNPYIIYGARNLLDAPGEWYHDGQTLSYIPIGKLTDIEVRRRELGVDLSGVSYITIRGISFFAAAPSLKDSVSCRIEDCHFRYAEHFRELKGSSAGGPIISGKDNEIRHCSFGRTAGSALSIRGEGNRLIDSVIFDTDYVGAWDGAVNAGNSIGTVIDRCTILRTGRDGIIHHGSHRIQIMHCDISHVDLLNSDSGGIYCWGTDGIGSVIAYNQVHDNTGDMNAGIYLDNFCHDFSVHHNLSWNNTGAGITLNSSAENHLVANNTLVNNGQTFATFAYTGRLLTQKGTRILNNLVTGTLKPRDTNSFAQGDLAPELSHNGKGAIDDRGMPLPNSAAIDAGIPVPGITDGFKGKAPDIGAYEAGAEPWLAGATWAPADMPKGERTSIAWASLPKVTQSAMLTKGLALWLDTSDRSTIKTDAQKHVTRWLDKSGKHLDAIPADPDLQPTFTDSAIAGHPAVGGGAFHLAQPAGDSSPVTLVLVAASPRPGEPWQRLASAWNGTEKDWITPNWSMSILSAEKPTGFLPQVFFYRSKEPRTLANLTLGGTAMGKFHVFTGQLAEVLLYTRALNDEEQEALTTYLNEKWNLTPP